MERVGIRGRRQAVASRVHPYAWLWERLEGEPTFVLRSMFGAKAVYLSGKLYVCLIARAGEPWHGLLVCTDHSHHASLQSEFPGLSPHPVLPKWLYLSDTTASFDRTAEKILALAARRDPRLGVIPKPRKPRKRGRIQKRLL